MRARAVVALAATTIMSSMLMPAEASRSWFAFGCDVASVDHETAGEEIQTGVITGGPLVSTKLAGSMEMICVVQVGAANATHAGTDSCAVHSGTAARAVVILPTFCSYMAPDAQPAYLCTEAVVDGTTWYRTAWADWTLDANAPCDELIVQDPAKVSQPDADSETFVMLFNLLDPVIEALNDPQIEFLDPALCPLFAQLDGSAVDRYPNHVDPDGDMWFDFDLNGEFASYERYVDCPPYSD